MLKNEVVGHSLVVEAINEKLESRELRCPISGSINWEVSLSGTTLPAIDLSLIPEGDSNSVFPMAVVTCKDCGYTFFVNLVALGLAEELGISAGSND